MEAFLRRLAEQYPDDTLTAGLQTAYLPDQDKFYCSVHRLPTGIKSRTIIAKASEDTFEGAIAKCREVWEKMVLDQKNVDEGVV